MQEVLKVPFGVLHAVRQALLAENAEEALDQVHPGGMRGCVVKLDLLMAAEPSPRRLVLVDVEVVHDDVQFSVPVRVPVTKGCGFGTRSYGRRKVNASSTLRMNVCRVFWHTLSTSPYLGILIFRRP